MFGWWKLRKRIVDLEGCVEGLRDLNALYRGALDECQADRAARHVDQVRRSEVARASARVGTIFATRVNALVQLDGLSVDEATGRVASEPFLYVSLVLSGAVERMPEGHRSKESDALLALLPVIAPGCPLGAAVDGALHREL